MNIINITIYNIYKKILINIFSVISFNFISLTDVDSVQFNAGCNDNVVKN